MSRADRIVQRRTWLSLNPWVDKGKGNERKPWRRWVLEWRLFKTHDNVKVKEGMVRMLNEREIARTARETARAEAQATT